MINFVCRNAAVVALYHYAGYGTQIYLEERTIILGLSLGFFLPMFSNIVPMRQVISKQLRNALNPVRSNGDDIEV
jgi:hypothetical protein